MRSAVLLMRRRLVTALCVLLIKIKEQGTYIVSCLRLFLVPILRTVAARLVLILRQKELNLQLPYLGMAVRVTLLLLLPNICKSFLLCEGTRQKLADINRLLLFEQRWIIARKVLRSSVVDERDKPTRNGLPS